MISKHLLLRVHLTSMQYEQFMSLFTADKMIFLPLTRFPTEKYFSLMLIYQSTYLRVLGLFGS